MASAALIAALYAALTLFLAPLSFGMIQIRVSEALTILPAVYPPAILGLSLGCFLSNVMGFVLGANPLGLIDAVVGTFATFLAAILTYYIGKKVKGKALYFLAPIPPVIVNAVFIGTEISILFLSDTSLKSILLCCLYVLLGQLIPCFLGGSLLIKNSGKFLK